MASVSESMSHLDQTINMDTTILTILMVLSIGSLNINGTSPDRLMYLDRTMETLDIMLVQEHWLHTPQIDKLISYRKDLCIHGISGMDISKLSLGRPYGGVAMIWKKNRNWTVKPITIPSKRVCGVTIEINTYKLLLMSVYMPYEASTNNLQEYNDILNVMSQVMNEHSVNNVIIGGDFNTDLKRAQSSNSKSLCSFINNETLYTCLYLPFASVDYTYNSKINNSRHTLDHFIVSHNMLPSICKYGVNHDGDNLSDHDLINLDMDIPEDVRHTGNITDGVNKKPTLHHITILIHIRKC